MANIAYVRVSSVDQNEQRQLDALEKYDIDEWFIEKASAKDTNRAKLNEMLKYARKGDTIHIHSFDRFARSTKNLLDLVEQLQVKGVELVSHKESIDTNTAVGKLMLTMIGAINEFERTNMLERQKEGIAIAKADGKYKGRNEIERPDNWNEIYNQWIVREITATKAMDLMGLKRNTFYKLVKEYKEEQAQA